MRLVSLFVAVSLAASPLATSAAQASEDARHAAIDAVFAGFTNTSPGAAVGVYQHGKLVYAHGYGLADLETGTLITPQTRFHVASVSKEFTAFDIALLARDGKVDLNADIHRYLPDVPDLGAVIRVRHLLTHTSGLRDQWQLFRLGGQESHNVLHEQQILNVVARQRALNFAPGTEYMYCNTGYTLLGEIVRTVSGRSLRQFTNERIFQPLGMTRTFFYDDVREVVPDRAQSYTREGKGPWQRDLLNYDNVGATSLLTTVEDFARWAANFAHPVVGDHALIEQVSTNRTLDDGTPIRYAYGLWRTKLDGREIVTHSGSDAGFRALFVYYPAYDFAVTILANTDTDPAAPDGHLGLSDKAATIANLYLPRAALQPLTPKAPHPEPAPLAGTYVAPHKTSITLAARGDGLYSQSRELIQRADGSFDNGKPWDNYFTPVADATGKVTALDEHTIESGRVVRYSRVAPASPTPAALEELTGNYRSEELDVTYTIAVQGRNLTARSLWSVAPIVLHPITTDRFEADDDDLAIVVFDRDSRGHIKGLRVHENRIRNVVFQRVGP